MHGIKSKLAGPLDITVAVFILLHIAFSIFSMISSIISEELFRSMQLAYETPFFISFTILTCCILASWLFLGKGVDSPLWKWLPPLLFFKDFNRLFKYFLVIALIVGTLVGLFGMVTGKIDPAF